MPIVTITKNPGEIFVEVKAATTKELFVKAAAALANIFEGSEGLDEKNRKFSEFEQTISVSAVDLVSLLVEWLTELISVSDLESVVLDQVSIDTIDETSLTAQVSGHHLDEFLQPVSAVNYDTVKIRDKDDEIVASFSLEI